MHSPCGDLTARKLCNLLRISTLTKTRHVSSKGSGTLVLAQPAETGPSRSLDVATPPFTAPAFGLARNVVEQAPSCRLRRHRSLPGPSRTPVSAHSLRNQRPASPSCPAPTGHLSPCCRHGRPPVVCQTGNRHGQPRPAISSTKPSFLLIFVGLAVNFSRQAVIFGRFCWLSGHFCPPGHHFGLFLLARRSLLSAMPSFSAIFVGLSVVMAGPDRPSLPPGHHFGLFLLAQRSFLSARPSFSALFAGLAVVFVRQTIIFAHFCRLGGQFFPSGHHFRPFLSA